MPRDAPLRHTPQELDDALGGSPVQVHVVQGEEPPEFRNVSGGAGGWGDARVRPPHLLRTDQDQAA